MSAVYVECVGPEGAIPVVLVHGWAMHGGLWGSLRDDLATRYRLHVVDLPGHGLGEANLPAEEIGAWADALLARAPPRAVWVGWSLGGLIALAAAARAPARVAGIGLIASTPSFVCREGWPHAVEAAALTAFSAALAADAHATLSRFLGLQVRGAAGANTILRALRVALASRPASTPAAMRAGLGLLLETDLRADLACLKLPLRAVFGARDTLIPAGAARALLKLLPTARAEVVAGAGHVPFWSHPDAVGRTLDGLVADAF